jgi:hypothetical protein
MADYGVQERPRPSRQENAEAQHAYHLQQGEQPRQAPPELDVRVFDARVGERDNKREEPRLVDDPAMQAARQAFESFHGRLSYVAEAETAVRQDTTLTEDARLLEIANIHAAPRGQSPTQRAGEARERIRDSRRQAESRIASALKSQMTEGEAREVRDRLSAMSHNERESVLQDIRKNGDVRLAAALAAPSSHVASGLDRGTYRELRRYVENALTPEDAARRDQLARAEDELNRAEEMYLKTALAWQPDSEKVDQIRQRQERSRRVRGQE